MLQNVALPVVAEERLLTLFTDLERAILSSIRRRGSATAEQVREDMAAEHKLKESTVRTLLARLENKGFLKYKVEGRTYVYGNVPGPQGFAMRAVRRRLGLGGRLCD
jgi:BlaI family transcriptional regulator, penicillinase repressor